MKNYKIGLLLVLSICVFTWMGCTKTNNPPVEKIYRFSETITVDGRERTFVLNLPPNYYEVSGFSMVIGMHGGGGEISGDS